VHAPKSGVCAAAQDEWTVLLRQSNHAREARVADSGLQSDEICVLTSFALTARLLRVAALLDLTMERAQQIVPTISGNVREFPHARVPSRAME